jgi:hypothetical protein
MSDGNKLLSDVSSKYGAPMGRRNITDIINGKVRLFRVRMLDYCYDRGGAYWGMGEPLYAAIGDGFQFFLRAKNRPVARQKILNLYPDLKIRR